MYFAECSTVMNADTNLVPKSVVMGMQHARPVRNEPNLGYCHNFLAGNVYTIENYSLFLEAHVPLSHANMIVWQLNFMDLPGIDVRLGAGSFGMLSLVSWSGQTKMSVRETVLGLVKSAC